jgi:hypothetical protein
MSTETGPSKTPYEHPWKGAPDGAAANVALADLINNLPRQMTVDGRLHAESLLAASGAIAGYAAQRAVMDGMTSEQIIAPSSGFDIVRTSRGGFFFYGEPLDHALVPLSPADPHKLWTLAASGAIDAGLDVNELPDVGAMFEYVAMALGSDREGLPSVFDVLLEAPAWQLLRSAWPLALMCFNGQISGQALNPPIPVSQRWRPVIAAIAANKMIRHTALAVPPKTALIIVMESAIYASKLAPSVIEAQAPAANA